MTVDLVITNARVFVLGELVEAGLAIDEGKIASIAKEAHLPAGGSTIDAHGNVILPGTIDTHVHLRDPGPPSYFHEDFQTGTESAACGGATTVLEMPMEGPYISTVAALKEKMEDAKRKAVVDYALYGGVDPTRLEGIAELAREGVIGYKILMWPPQTPTSKLSSAPFPVTSDDKSLLAAFYEISKTGLPVSTHAENWQMIEYYTEIIKQQGRKDPLAHCDARPEITEIDAISRAILIAKECKAKLLVAHMSTEGGAELVRRAKRAGQDLAAETCPHYLLFTREDMEKLGPYAKVMPPIRSKSEVAALWEAVNDGTVDVIGTDHTARLAEEKEPGRKDIWAGMAGMPGVETKLPLMLTQVNSGRLSLARLVQILSENPARLFGLYPRKGVIQVGSDADLVLVDMKQESQIRDEDLHCLIKRTPFSGWRVRGVPIRTLIRGQTVVENRDVVGKAGIGMFLPGKLQKREG